MTKLRLELGAVIAIAGALLLVSAPANADAIVYNGGTPDLGGTIYAEAANGWAVGLNFTLPSGVTSVSDANWWGGCYPDKSCGSSPNFVLSFYNDSVEGPGTLIASFNVGGANQTATGNQIGGLFAEYSYSATFAPVTLTSGTQYWFGISGTTGAGTFGVETTSTAPTGSQLFTYGIDTPGTWSPDESEHLAFQLTAGVPEPSTWAMMLIGFASLGFAFYRRSKYIGRGLVA